MIGQVSEGLVRVEELWTKRLNNSSNLVNFSRFQNCNNNMSALLFIQIQLVSSSIWNRCTNGLHQIVQKHWNKYNPSTSSAPTTLGLNSLFISIRNLHNNAASNISIPAICTTRNNIKLQVGTRCDHNSNLSFCRKVIAAPCVFPASSVIVTWRLPSACDVKSMSKYLPQRHTLLLECWTSVEFIDVSQVRRKGDWYKG